MAEQEQSNPQAKPSSYDRYKNYSRKSAVPDKPTQEPFSPELTKAVLGRPSLYRPEYAQQVLEWTAQGYSVNAWAGKIGVAPSTIRDWAASYPDFAEACARAKAARLYWWEEKAIHYVEKEISGPVSLIMFALKNAGPEDWKEKIVTEHEVGETLAGLIERSMGVKGRTIDVTPVKRLIDKPDSDITD